MSNESSHQGDFAATSVPTDNRRSLLSISLVLIGVPICASALFAGSALAKGHTFQAGVQAVLVGGLILTLIAGLIGTIGVRTGLSTSLLVRNTFGIKGGALVSFVLALTLIGWFGVQVGFFGESIQAAWPAAGLLTSEMVSAYWGGLLMLSTAYFGFRGLSVLSSVAVPLVALLCVWGVASVVAEVDILAYQPTESASLSQGITLVVGSFAVGAVVLPDITRYARSTWHTWIITFLGFLVANAFVQISGMLTSMATGSADLITSMLALGMGIPALLVLILGQWTTNDNNMYSASLAISGAVPTIKKRYIVLVCGIIATILGAHGLADSLVPYLLWLGILIPPIGGVLIADFLILNGIDRLEAPSEPVRWPSLIAWALGAVTGGVLELGIPAVNAILSAFVIYLILEKVREEKHQPL